jgi:hypothetical protein
LTAGFSAVMPVRKRQWFALAESPFLTTGGLVSSGWLVTGMIHRGPPTDKLPGAFFSVESWSEIGIKPACLECPADRFFFGGR